MIRVRGASRVPAPPARITPSSSRRWTWPSSATGRGRGEPFVAPRGSPAPPPPSNSTSWRLNSRRASTFGAPSLTEGLSTHHYTNRRRGRRTSARSMRSPGPRAGDAGLAVGPARALLLSLVPRRVAAGFGLITLTALVMLVAQAPADPVLRAEPARLGAGPLHPLPRRGAVGRLDLAVRGALLPAGAPGGARAATADARARGSSRAEQLQRQAVRSRRRLGELVQHAHVVPARHRLADRHRGAGPRPAAISAFWRRNSSLSSAPTTRDQRPRGAGMRAGLRRRGRRRVELRGRARGTARGAAARARTRRRRRARPSPDRPAGRARPPRQSHGQHHRREVAAGRMAGDDDARPVAAVLGRVAPDPGERRHQLQARCPRCSPPGRARSSAARPSRRRRRRAARRSDWSRLSSARQ